MKERPILFSGPMVRAILAGTKTQTRRVVKLTAEIKRMGPDLDKSWADDRLWCVTPGMKVQCTLMGGEPEDSVQRLYNPWDWDPDSPVLLRVREAFRFRQDLDHLPPSKIPNDCWYAADPDSEPSGCAGGAGKLRPSIFMPRRLSRITLEITNVRARRLQNIPFYDIRAEGLTCPEHDFPSGFCVSECSALRRAWVEGWDKLNAKRGYSWELNPWVWVVDFKVVPR